jgi:23S rRNA (cytosine1962-C5)-methyltransferase
LSLQVLLRDAKELTRRLERAWNRRWLLRASAETTAFRWIHAASDGVPAITIDCYNEHAVLSLMTALSPEEELRLAECIQAWVKGAVYLKRRPRQASQLLRATEDDVSPAQPLCGHPAPTRFPILELGASYLVSLGDGLSTGIFLDQRDNRHRLAAQAKGARVLNLFAYTGAFTVAAIYGGAASSLTLDVSGAALTWARENIAQAGADPQAHQCLQVDVLQWLRTQVQRVAKGSAALESFDWIVLDPPSFATTKASRFRVDEDLGRLTSQAAAMLAPSGQMLVSTNQHSMSMDRLCESIRSALLSDGQGGHLAALALRC